MVISSTSNEWPQIDETGLMASSGRIMEKPRQLEQALKCPRCDSSNTKFCYYNNYSLSQPRHFCKACKRYWTRGGMLRNVPVGGGCKKNKRIKRTASSADAPPPSLPTTSTLTPTTSQIDLSSVSNLVSPLYYGLPNNPSDINLAFPRFHSRVSNMETAPISCTGYDLQPQLNTLGLGFSLVTMNSNDVHNDEYGAGFNPSSAQIHDVVSSNSLLSNYSLFGSTSSTSTCPTTASLITSGLREQNLIRNGLKETQPTNHFQAFLPFEDLKIAGNHDPGTFIKELKVEEGRNLGVPSQNPIEPIRSSDPPLYWNTTTVGSWPDLTYFGSSVTPLI